MQDSSQTEGAGLILECAQGVKADLIKILCMQVKTGARAWAKVHCRSESIEVVGFIILRELLLLMGRHQTNRPLVIDLKIAIQHRAKQLVRPNLDFKLAEVIREEGLLTNIICFSARGRLSVDKTICATNHLHALNIVTVLRTLTRHELKELETGQQAAKTHKAITPSRTLSLSASDHIRE